MSKFGSTNLAVMVAGVAIAGASVVTGILLTKAKDSSTVRLVPSVDVSQNRNGNSFRPSLMLAGSF